MKIHEYQAKALLTQFGIPVPEGTIASEPSEAMEIATSLEGKVVIKAQVYAGGRGKAGGIKLASEPEEAERLAGQMIGTMLVTHQTGKEGVPIHKVLVEKAVDIKKELYLGIVIDSIKRMPVIMASEAGGMNIEEVAQKSPEKILKVHIDPAIGFQQFFARRLCFGLKLEPAIRKQMISVVEKLYRLFMEKDCSLAEINPLVVTANNELLALDAKPTFDDNALFRHSDVELLRDRTQEDPLEVKAKELGISNYIKMEGNIGCMVNGAGLAMAAMDLINQAGGSPANFLDIGTVNDPNRVVNAFKIFTSDPSVKAIMINIFGGMTRCDIIARGIIEAHNQMNVRLPLVVRLVGTNAKEGRKLLKDSHLKYTEVTDFFGAACEAVAAVKGGQN